MFTKQTRKEESFTLVTLKWDIFTVKTIVIDYNKDTIKLQIIATATLMLFASVSG